MNFCRKTLKKIKLFVLYWTRIVFVKNNFKVSPAAKLRANAGGYLADQTVLYDFKNNDRSEYLSEFDWYRSRYINEPFDFAFNNKVVCTEILKHFIRMPENYFIKNKGNILDFQGGLKSCEDVYEVLKAQRRLIIKPFALGKGNGVHLISMDDADSIRMDQEVCSKEKLYSFLEERDGYIISEYMHQHRYASGLYDKTVNTIRLITMRDVKTHEFKIFFAVQRIGTSATIPVDNGSKGGLVSKIDLDTGILSEARCLHDLDTYYVHPDSHAAIKGVRIPNWQELKEEVLTAANKAPYMDFIAWDILVTEDGICVIEANTSSGVNIIQLWGGQRNGELGEFFRSYKIIK